MKSTMLALMLLAASTIAATAQESSLPDVCAPHMGHDMGAMAMDQPMAAMDEAHTALMAGMAQMHMDMDTGMMAADIDVAFVCGMIPHHQGAIDMAKAVIQHGDDPWVKDLAQNIITAQEGEIAQMKDWLAKNAGH